MTPAEVLPHRFPFLLVDRVLEVVPGKKAVALKRLSASDRLVQVGGALPGVFLLEACAQLCALAGAPAKEDSQGGAPPRTGYLVGIEGFEVLRRGQAGDSVELEIHLGRGFGKLQQVTFEARIDGEILSRGNLTVLNP